MTRFSFICTLTLFLLENMIYIILGRVLYSRYKTKINHHVQLLRFKPYSLYDRAFIHNFPSAHGKEFYKLSNKLTITFNIIIVFTFILFLVINWGYL